MTSQLPIGKRDKCPTHSVIGRSLKQNVFAPVGNRTTAVCAAASHSNDRIFTAPKSGPYPPQIKSVELGWEVIFYTTATVLLVSGPMRNLCAPKQRAWQLIASISPSPVSPQRGTQQIYFIRIGEEKRGKTSIRGFKSRLPSYKCVYVGGGGVVYRYRIRKTVTCTASFLMQAFVPPKRAYHRVVSLSNC